MKKLLLTAAAVLGSVVVAAPAFAAPPLGITSSVLKDRAGETDLILKAVCPNDPPQTLFITGDVGDGTGSRLLGFETVTCDSTRQRFVLPLTDVLPRGTVVSGVFISISGDGGEVDDHLDSLVVR